MAASTVELKIEQGSTFRLPFAWYVAATDASGNLILDANGQETPGAPYDLTGCTARMQIRKSIRAATPLVDATTENGLLALGGTDGQITINLTAAETDKITVTSAVYDLEVVFPNGDVHRVLQGTVTNTLNVTR